MVGVMLIVLALMTTAASAQVDITFEQLNAGAVRLLEYDRHCSPLPKELLATVRSIIKAMDKDESERAITKAAEAEALLGFPKFCESLIPVVEFWKRNIPTIEMPK